MNDEFLIILVDDDPGLLGILTYAAKETFPQARFLQMHNSAELETYFHQLCGYGPTLILLDLNLNESKDGVDILARLRYDEQTARIPVVMLTTNDSDANVLDAIVLGAASFTSKPTDLTGWKTYLSNLRQYWVNTVRTVPVWFPN